MGIFKIFKKNENKETSNKPKGFYELKVKNTEKTTPSSIQITFEIPSELKNVFNFTPGQYVNLSITKNGKNYRNSYSISSTKDELAIVVKAVENGNLSIDLQNTKPGDEILVSAPQGSFVYKNQASCVAFAAGSGITPIMSIARAIEAQGNASLNLFFGNKTINETIFYEQLKALKNTKTEFYLSKENNIDHKEGRLTKEEISNIIKNNLDLLKADAFYLCGPEEMIKSAQEVLQLFGVEKNKVFFELFTTPVNAKEEIIESEYKGKSKVSVLLDDEWISFETKGNTKSIVDYVTNEGYDAPYSCKGGVCCTCKAKIIEGSAKMKLNYSLTDEEVQEGYILTCQAVPTSENLKISYDI